MMSSKVTCLFYHFMIDKVVPAERVSMSRSSLPAELFKTYTHRAEPARLGRELSLQNVSCAPLSQFQQPPMYMSLMGMLSPSSSQSQSLKAPPRALRMMLSSGGFVLCNFFIKVSVHCVP